MTPASNTWTGRKRAYVPYAVVPGSAVGRYRYLQVNARSFEEDLEEIRALIKDGRGTIASVHGSGRESAGIGLTR